MNADDIVKALGGHHGACRCPAHDDRSPSLSVSISPQTGKVLVKCHAGCEQQAVIDALIKMGLWSGEPSCRGATVSPMAVPISKTGELALAIWATCRPAPGTLVERYLAARGITIEIPASIRFHSGLLYPGGGHWPAMVALVERAGVPVAIHRTFLERDGRAKKAPVIQPKMMLGPCSGGGVKLSEITDYVCIGEGIETCLSVQQAANVPTWAALSTAGMTSLVLPRGVKRVTILQDNDNAGEAAALAAGRRWRRAGLAVKIAKPRAGNKDFNDQLLAKKEAS